MNDRRKTSRLAIAVVGALCSTAYAQDKTAAGALEEVVVTAQKRAESVQTVPIAITALGEDAIARAYLANLGDLVGAAPNVQLEQNPVYGRSTSFTIRGIGISDGQASFDPPVGVVIDGVFINRTTGAVVDTFDLQQIEILRGPQGTLFGKNTTGGLVNITTKRPSGALGGGVEVRIGNYNRREYKGYLEFPIVTDRVATRISALSTERDGYAKNIITGADQDFEDVKTARAVTTFNNGAAFDGVLSLEYSKDGSGSAAMENLSDTAGIGFFVCSVMGRCNDGDPRRVESSVAPQFDMRTGFAAATLNWHLANHTLTSVSGYRKVDFKAQPLDADATALAVLDVNRREDVYQVSQELRLASDTAGALSYVGGLYWFRQKYDFDQTIFSRDFLGALIPPAATFPFYNYVIGETNSYAGFLQADYRFSERWSVTAGGRYTKEKKEVTGTYQLDPFRFGDQINYQLTGVRPTPDYSNDRDSSNFSPKLAVNFNASENVLLYGSFTRGFKSGGFSDRAGNAESARPYKDEKVDSFELGVKSELFGRSLRINAAVFDSSYDDMQLEIQIPLELGGTSTGAVNAGKASIRGLELEASWIPMRGLRLDAAFGYIDAKFDQFCGKIERGLHGDPIGVGVITPECVAATGVANATDNTDLEFRNTPKTTYSLGANYDWVFAGAAALTFDARYFHSDDQFTDLPNDILGDRPSVSIVDASIAWRDASDKYRVSVYGRNLGDEEYLQSFGNTGNLAGLGVYMPPRTYGVQFNARFGD